MEITRKAWVSPQVFVLGAEKTLATGSPATGEGDRHILGGIVHLKTSFSGTLSGSTTLQAGYKS